MRRRTLLALSTLVAGCGQVEPPTVDPIAPVTGNVGEEVRIALRGRAPAASRVTFDFASPDINDLKTRKRAATITTYAGGAALFRWFPLATDAGPHEIDFLAVARGALTVVPLAVTVVPGAGVPPQFRVPVGEGSTLDLARGPCAEIEVIVEQSGATEVDLRLEAPVPDNASLTASGPFSAQLRFCPSEAQVAARLVYPLTLSANDTIHPKAIKRYTMVVRLPTGMGCATRAPEITVQPRGDVVTASNLFVTARITDDVAVTSTRLLWSLVEPKDLAKPDFTGFAPLSLTRKSGDIRVGDYEAVIPNPVVSSVPGTAKRIFFAVEAADDDPPKDCGHRSLAPPAGVYTFVVRRP